MSRPRPLPPRQRPLLVLDADADRSVPIKSLPSLVEWTAEWLHGSGKDADPLLALTEAACERYGLPAEPSHKERLYVQATATTAAAAVRVPTA